jgi:hypothetical protein
MNLNVGERLPGSGPSQQPGGYVVSALVAETPYSRLYAGKKIFYNFDFTNKRLRETDEAEWVDVYLRTIRYSVLDDPTYVTQRRTLARAEVRRILGARASNLWPEPLDLLELPKPRDPFTFPVNDSEPVVVFARPHALPLSDWRRDGVSPATVLGVLAELLQFLDQAHAEGLLLYGLGPDAVLVDRGANAHYVGTDLVIEAPHEDWSPDTRRLLFPYERFPRGFTAPEFFELAASPDARGDFYAWAALGYFLLTGHSPAEIAFEQRQPWAHFQDAHFARLEKSLSQVPAERVRDWSEQLGIQLEQLTSAWPANIVRLFRTLLHPDRERRPASARELITWINAPPPVPPVAVLALITSPGEAHVFLDWGAFGVGLDMVIRRGVGQPPLTPDEGVLLEQGPTRGAVADANVPLTLDPVYYTVFAQRYDGGEPLYSAGVSAELEESSPAAFLRLAEKEARQGADLLPPRLALLFDVMYRILLIRALSRSELATVRGWALTALEEEVRADPSPVKTDELLWQFLRDPDPALCRRAAAILLTRPRTDDAILRMARFGGRGNVDETARMLDVFVAAGFNPAVASRLRERLEEERPTECPECGIHLARRERAEHLKSVHGYIELEGGVWPRSRALERLWDQILLQGERSSHERLLKLLASAPQGMASTYVASLEETLTHRAERLDHVVNTVGDEPPRLSPFLRPYVVYLSDMAGAEQLVGEMLRSPARPVRVVGGECWLAILGKKSRSVKLTAKSLQVELEGVASPLEEKINLCRRLPETGIDAGAARACLALLEADRLVPCAECGARIRLGEIETHLRRGHGVFQFRGHRGSFPAIRDAVLAAVVGPVADEGAWRTLEELARDQHGPEAEPQLGCWLCERLEILDAQPRAAASAALSEVLTQCAAGPRLIPSLITLEQSPTRDVLARQLALEIGARLPAPVDQSLVAFLEPLLSERDVPLPIRQHATVGLVRTTGKAGTAAIRLFEAYVVKSGKLRAIEKLHELEQYIGQSAALDALCARLEDQVRMNCPKCAAELIRKDMVPHLWQSHRLVLDGRRVREPWRVLQDWVVDYGLERDPALSSRCQELASKMDPEGGLALFERTLLRHGIEDRAAQADLSVRAAQNRATLCPRCFVEVPMSALPDPPALSLDADGLEGAGFRVSLSERGIFSAVEIETPAESIRAREPGNRLTRNGALVVVVLPLVLMFFILGELVTRFSVSPPPMMLLSLGMGLLLAGLVFLFWHGGLAQRERVINAAWSELVPRLLEQETPAAMTFLGGLALVSLRKGAVEPRSKVVSLARDKLNDLVNRNLARAEYANWTDKDRVPASTLTALVQLAVTDVSRRGGDPLPVVVEQVVRCLRGLLPLCHGVQALEDFFGVGASRSSKAGQARAQILICDRAFASGLELADLNDIGKTHPVLAAVLGLADKNRLTCLRELWACKATRPWERYGQAVSVFDLAATAGFEKHFERIPDLLVQIRGHDIALGSRGVWFQDTCWTTPLEKIEVIDRRVFNDAGFDLAIGNQRLYFAHNPQDLAAELEVWMAYYFKEFLTGLAAWQDWPGSELGWKLRRMNAVICPECGVKLWGCLGAVGANLGE